MAIKGKSKGRTAKAVTRGPKPVYQPVKKPLARQARVLAGDRGASSAWRWSSGWSAGFIIERNASEQDDLEQRMRAAMNTYQGELEPILATIGQARAPSGFDAFADLRHGRRGPGGRERRRRRSTRRRSSRRPTDTLARPRPPSKPCRAIDETALIRGKGFSEDFVLYVINSKGNLVRAMILYREAAQLLELAAGAEGAERAELAAPHAGHPERAPTRSSTAATRTTSRRRPRRACSRRRRRCRASRRRPALHDRRPPPPPRLAGRRPDVGAAARRRSRTDLAVAAPHLPGFGDSEPAGDVMTMARRRRAGARGDGGARHRPGRRLRALDGRVRGVRDVATGSRARRRVGPGEHPGRGRPARGRGRPARARRTPALGGQRPGRQSRRRCCRTVRRRSLRARVRAWIAGPVAGSDRRGACSGWRSGPTPRPTSRRSTSRRSCSPRPRTA